MKFQLDTTGFVSLNLDGKVDPNWMNETAWTFSGLSPFTQGYIEGLFEASSDDLDRQWREGGDWNDAGNGPFGFSDLAPETLARIIADCEALSAKWLADYQPEKIARLEGAVAWADRQSGDLMYLHGRFPPLTVQLGDDGKVRFG